MQASFKQKGPTVVSVQMTGAEARALLNEMEDVAQAFPEPGLLQGDTPCGKLYQELQRLAGPLGSQWPERVPSDRPTVVDPYPGVHLPSVSESESEPEPSGREAATDLPKYIDVLAAHIPAAQREFTVRIFHCDFTGRRSPNEALARTFPTEDKARQFYVSTQNIQNMKIRAKEAVAIDVVLGVQDKRSHAKKKSYREWEHTLCKGGPG